MAKKSKGLSKVARIILLIIPGVNFIYELIIRWGAFLKKKSTLNLVIAIVCTLAFGCIWAYVDAILVALRGKESFM